MPVEAGSARSSVDGLNAAGTNAFVQAMAPYFEDSPRFLARLAAARPFQDERHLFERAAAIADAMPEEEQVELVDAHPRIGAAARMMSVASLAEQGHERATQPVQADLDRLNAAYEARFGFRFVVFVAGRPRSEILPLIEARLGGERDTELRAALTDVIAIARDRWRKARLGEW
jgi:OHCU decarboxylase